MAVVDEIRGLNGRREKALAAGDASTSRSSGATAVMALGDLELLRDIWN